MSFFSEIAKRAGVPELTLPTGYNIINYNGKVVYIEGLRKLLAVDSNEIRLELSGAIVTLKGLGLHIFELSETAIIKGDILAMEFTEYSNKGRGKNVSKKKNK